MNQPLDLQYWRTPLDCGHLPTVQREGSIATGKVLNDDGETQCYECAFDDIMDDIVLTGIEIEGQREWKLPTLFVSSDGTEITTWDGRFIGRVTAWGRLHSFSRERRYMSARIAYGADVVNCYGIGAPGMYALLRRYVSDIERR